MPFLKALARKEMYTACPEFELKSMIPFLTKTITLSAPPK